MFGVIFTLIKKNTMSVPYYFGQYCISDWFNEKLKRIVSARPINLAKMKLCMSMQYFASGEHIYDGFLTPGPEAGVLSLPASVRPFVSPSVRPYDTGCPHDES